ncbi:SGNH/GDSL hydrolase family protein [Williamsia maris]|uniref:Lysophospholipase L1 n=1 Tax=Williamsia maris TaxID=72806 RepID=A0ABT1H7S2_9NOCA|nr:SGNH/GDSL hydrolase family protein [Williamsia maris]MCP2174259.1 Lysophospholipase L1 [Williamsia maris]
MSDTEPAVRRFVVIGDSFPEGVGDPEPRCPNGVRGWADRMAEVLARRTVETGVAPTRYANLAIRGKLLGPVVDDQLEPAVAMTPDLVGMCAGANDLLRPSVDIDAIIARYDDALGALVDTGARVFTFTAFDTGGRPLFAAMRGRFAIYNELLREVVERRGVDLVDFWRMHEFSDRRMWEFDRMHLSSAGHHQMAIRVLESLGIDHDLVPVAFGPPETMTAAQRRKDNRQWAAQAAAPWIGRRLRGRSRGDNMAPKYPDLTELVPATR